MFKRFMPLSPVTENKPSDKLEGLLLKKYDELVASKRIDHDPAQIVVLQHLQELLNHVVNDSHEASTTRFYRKPSNDPNTIKSVYIYGDVGRGKSMLMDLFFDNCPISQKRRVHFHTFMHEVHDYSHRWRIDKKTDVLTALAHEINKNTRLLCFDEFHVIDVVNAVILDRLFSQLYRLGTVIVSTSNRHPDDLYQGGVTPELFSAFIKLLKEKSDILKLSAEYDYRLNHPQTDDSFYITPNDDASRIQLESHFHRLTNNAPITPQSIFVFGHSIPLLAAHHSVALCSFQDLCSQPLGPSDYLKISTTFKTLILSDIPKLVPEKHDDAKRFSTLIDALYFHKVKLICSAEVAINELYNQDLNAFFLKRTVSRLIEMQSNQYWQE
ncbi:MAG: AFG1 family ATPase [Methylomicrobium sp.]|nr:AFG1 family ATPase [Methylomicrobium sp.]